jgi:hypothetical protein
MATKVIHSDLTITVASRLVRPTYPVKQRSHQETKRLRPGYKCFSGLLHSEPSVRFDAPERFIGGEFQFGELRVG